MRSSRARCRLAEPRPRSMAGAPSLPHDADGSAASTWTAASRRRLIGGLDGDRPVSAHFDFGVLKALIRSTRAAVALAATAFGVARTT